MIAGDRVVGVWRDSAAVEVASAVGQFALRVGYVVRQEFGLDVIEDRLDCRPVAVRRGVLIAVSIHVTRPEMRRCRQMFQREVDPHLVIVSPKDDLEIWRSANDMGTHGTFQ